MNTIRIWITWSIFSVTCLLATCANSQDTGRRFGLTLAGGFSGGLPLGMPPGPQDETLDYVAPEDCGLFVRWNGTSNAPGKSRLENLIVEDEIQSFMNAVVEQWKIIVDVAASESGAEGAVFVRSAAGLAEEAIQASGAAYLGLNPETGIRAGYISGSQLDPKRLDQFLASLNEQVVEKSKTEGIPTYSILTTPLPCQIAIVDGRCIVAFGDGELKAVVQRMRNKRPPTWLRQIRETLSLERESNLSYVNVDHFAAAANDGDGSSSLANLGLSSVSAMACLSGIDGEDVVVHSWEKSSELGPLKEAVLPIEASDLQDIPSDAAVAGAIKLDFQKIAEMLVSAAGVNRELDQLRVSTGFDPVRDIAEAVGVTTIQVYSSPTHGGSWLTGWTATFRVASPDKLAATIEKLQPMISAGIPDIVLRKTTFNDHVITYLWAPEGGMIIAPAWSFVKDRMIVSTYPQGVKSHIAALNKVADREDSIHTTLLKGDAVAAIAADEEFLAQALYPLLQAGLSGMPSPTPASQRQVQQFDIADLPSLACLTRHLASATARLEIRSNGLHVVRKQTSPPTGLALVASILASESLVEDFTQPLVDRLNPEGVDFRNMEEIALGFHNHHDALGQFPRSAIRDPNGKPLLSWRVKILPFMGETALYEQFHLDEPWDSPHNAKLIAKIPAVFQSPSLADQAPGRTTYLAIVAKGSIMPDFDSRVRLEDISDGTSNTLMFVRSTDQHAVTWTKPSDLVPGAEVSIPDAIAKTSEGYLIAFCDGFVTEITGKLSKQEWKNLYQINDGNWVQIYDSTGSEEAASDGDTVEMEPERQSNPLVEKARELAKNGNHQAAVKLFEQVLAATPNQIEAMLGLGNSLWETNAYEPSEKVFAQCVKLAPDRFEARLGLAKAVWVQDRNEESIPLFEQAIELNDQSFEAWLYAALARRSLKRHDEAIKHFDRALKLNPEHWYGNYQRANSHYDTGQYAKAIAGYTKAIDLRPNEADAYYYRGFSYRALDQYDKAIPDFAVVLDGNPLNIDMLSFRGEAYKENGQPAFAIRDYTAIIGIDPKNAEAWKERGRCWMDLENYDQAISDQQHGASIEPDQWVHSNLAICWERKGDYQKASEAYTQALAIAPDYLFARQWRAFALGFKLQEYKQAKEDYELALTSGGNQDVSVLGNYAWFLAACPEEECRDGAKAIKLATRGVELSQGKDAWIIANLAAAHASTGDFPKAIETAQRALQVADSDELRQELVSDIESYRQDKKPAFKE